MPIKVYYLDDEPDLCNIFEAFVSGDDIVVTTFTDVNEAVDLCRRIPPDMIFIDYRLTDTTGDKVASLIDERVCKILVTGDLYLPESDKFQHTLQKPFSLADTRNLVLSQYNENLASDAL